MNRLLIDLGNSRLKWAWLGDGPLLPSHAVLHRGLDMNAVLDQAWGELDVPVSLHGASVVSRALRATVDDWAASRWGVAVEWIDSGAQALGLQNGYEVPEQLGVDRWLAMVAAWQRKRNAACVVDCGSAITIDILDADGRHLGGWIAPGLHMMRAALVQGTALPPVAGTGSRRPGRNTAAAILNGTLQAAVGMLEQAMQQLPHEGSLLLTGGDADELAQALCRPHEIRPDLVLEGLAAIVKGA